MYFVAFATMLKFILKVGPTSQTSGIAISEVQFSLLTPSLWIVITGGYEARSRQEEIYGCNMWDW